MTILGAFLLSLACAAALTPLVARLAGRAGAFDLPRSSRKVHVAPTPRLGGAAITVAFGTTLLALAVADPSVAEVFHSQGSRCWGLALGGTLIAAVGVYDDVRGASATTKLTFQFAAALIVYALGFRIDAIANPFGESLQLGWLGLPFTLLWIAGVTNAMNLIDGLDGLAGGVALLAVGATFLLALHQGWAATLLVCAALAGALVGFLRYNFNPASIFMGDSGSMFLGFVLATGAISVQEHANGVALINPIVLLGLPIGDTLLAMGRRAVRGVPLFQPDRGHIHHRLLDLGLSHRSAVLVLYAASALLGATALGLAFASRDAAALLLVAAGAAVAVALRGLGYLRLVDAAGLLERRQRNVSRRAAVRAAAANLREATGVVHVWTALKDVRVALGAETVALSLYGETQGGHRSGRHFAVESEAAGDVCRIRRRLSPRARDAAVVEFGWLPATRVDGDIEFAVEQLCAAVQSALARILGVGVTSLGDIGVSAAESSREAVANATAIRGR